MNIALTDWLPLPSLSAKAKHAIKFGLAIVICYYLALNFSWMNPTWAAIAVAMTALPTAGQSLAKGLLRAKGTFIAFFAGLSFLILFPQDRWLMLLALTPYIGFVTYKMTGKDGQYAWFVAGFVSLMIVIVGPSEPGHVFLFAAYRTLETLIGIAIWTLISVFIWPVTNRGNLEQITRQLLDSEQAALSIFRANVRGENKGTEYQPEKSEQLLAQLAQVSDAAGAESYEVRMAMPNWRKLQAIFAELTAIGPKLHAISPELDHLNIEKVIPGLELFLKALSQGIGEARKVMDGQAPSFVWQDLDLKIDPAAAAELDHFQRAAIEVLLADLNILAERIGNLLRCIILLKGYPLDSDNESELNVFTASSRLPKQKTGFWAPLDPDRLKYSLYVVLVLWVGFLIWIYIDPPGHVNWAYFMPNVAMFAMQLPQIRLKVAKTFLIAYLTLLSVYIFIMPELSQFWQLGILLFVLCSLFSYYLSAMVAPAFYLGVFSMLGISNTQHYDVAAMMNTILFTVGTLMVVYALSFLIGSPRPQRVWLKMFNRYFHSCSVIMSWLADPSAHQTIFARWRIAYYRQEVRDLPAKMAVWGKQIATAKMAGLESADIQQIVASLQVVTLRLESLCIARQISLADSLGQEVNDEIDDWRRALARAFSNLAKGGHVDSVDKIKSLVEARLERLNKCCEQAINENDQVTAEELRHLYQLLGCYRNLTHVTLVCLEQKQALNWQSLRAECF